MMFALTKYDGSMPPEVAFKGCMMLLIGSGVFAASIGALILCLSKAGCV